MREDPKGSILVDRAIFDNIDNLFFLIDESGSISHTNFQVKVQLFFSDSQLATMNLFDLIHANNLDQFQNVMIQVQNSRTPQSISVKVLNSLKIYIKYKISISLGEKSSKFGDQFVILGQKISSSTKFAHIPDFPQNLFPSELLMGKVFDESRYGIAVFDIRGNVLQVNRVILNYFDIKMLQNYNFFKDPIFKKNEVLEKIQQVLDTKIPAQTDPLLYNTHEYDPSFPDNPIWLQVMIFTLSDADQSSPRIVLMFRDTTEQSEKEHSVEAYQQELEGLLTKRALAEKTLAQISSQFVKPEGYESMEKFDAIVKNAMREIGEYTQADEVFIVQTHDIETSPAVSLTHEWCKTPEICFQNKIQNMAYPNYSYWASVFPNDIPIIINRDYNPDRLGPYFEKIIETYNISTLAVYSLKIQNKIMGLVGIVSTHQSLQWTESDLTVLQVFSEMLGNFLETSANISEIKQKERKLREHELQIQYSSVMSMISSMLIADMPDLEKKMQDILPTLGYTMKKSCNLIALLRTTPEAGNSEKITIQGLWTAPGVQLDKGEFETFLSTSLYKPLTDQLSQKLFRVFRISSFSPRVQKQAQLFTLRSILSVPIFARSQLYGTLLVNSASDHTFSQKETTLFLNVGIVIGFSIHNQMDQNQKSLFFDAVQIMDAAIFIVRDNRYIYVNQAFEKLAGHSAMELYAYDDLFSHIKPRDDEIIAKLHQALEKDPKMNLMLEYDIETSEKTIPSYITLSGGLYGGQQALFGIITKRPSPSK